MCSVDDPPISPQGDSTDECSKTGESARKSTRNGIILAIDKGLDIHIDSRLLLETRQRDLKTDGFDPDSCARSPDK